MKRVKEERFFNQMDANPQAVYVVECYSGVDCKQIGLFSTKKKADEWCESRPEEETCVVCPYIIDEPDFGNARKQ